MSEWVAKAPANIALIKYMGKKGANLSLNPSFSYSNNNFNSTVSLVSCSGDKDIMDSSGFGSTISSCESYRFLSHLAYVKKYFGFSGYFKVKSCNNFPPSCGLASSASSFAALTMAACKAICELSETGVPSNLAMSQISRLGSGSSCRSFFEPWVVWRDDIVEAVDIPFTNILHYVVVVSSAKKLISSSDAHKRVQSSALFSGRADRATKRLYELLCAMRANDWKLSFDLVWADFWDMHAMFETSSPGFGYMTPGSLFVLDAVRRHWVEFGDGPLVTMDAGPNVHLIFRADQKGLANIFVADMQNKYTVLGG